MRSSTFELGLRRLVASLGVRKATADYICFNTSNSQGYYKHEKSERNRPTGYEILCTNIELTRNEHTLKKVCQVVLAYTRKSKTAGFVFRKQWLPFFVVVVFINPFTPNIKDQILSSCPHTYSNKSTGEITN